MRCYRGLVAAASMLGLFAWGEIHAVHAQVRPVELTVVTGTGGFESLVKLDVSAQFQELSDAGFPGEVETIPQKTSGEISGRPSDRAPLEGTLLGIYDQSNNRVQIYGGHVSLADTGDYCPGDDDNNPDEACPYEETAEVGFYVGSPPGTPGDGGAGNLRDSLFSVRGSSAIVGSNINVLNWHGRILDGAAALDGYGPILEGLVGFDVSRFDDLQENAFHFESQEGEVNENTFFMGSFSVAGETATLSLPVYSPVWIYDDPGNPDPDEYFKLLVHSINETTGLDDQVSASGTLGGELDRGDANMDGKVDGLDVNIVSLHWQKGVTADNPGVHTANQRELHTVEHPKYSVWIEGDFDLNATTDDADLALLVANFGAGAGSGGGAGMVPEPSSLVLAALAFLVVIHRRRHGSGG